MTYIMIVNKSAWPIHGALSWLTIQQQCFNDLSKRGASHDFPVGLGWHDLTIVPGASTNKFDPAKNNSAVAILGVVFRLMSIANPGPLGLSVMVQPSTVTDQWTLGVEPAGKGSGEKPVSIQGKPLELHPVKVERLYAPHGYTVTVTGGDIHGTYDKASNVYTVTSVDPLRLHWENRTTGSKGDEVART